ncbi:MAG: glycosyltransferase [Candidatus Aminicenantes bacterium]|nr:glycosyltransferase [Candidatus Aminicenantes bacterium]
MKLAEIFVFVGLIYMVCTYSIDLLFSLVGLAAIKRRMRKNKRRDYPDEVYPSLNIIVPCYNEEKAVSRTIKALKEVDYPNLTITIVNDGSSDHTFDIISRELQLEPCFVNANAAIPTEEIKETYASSCNTFIVIDKTNGGKADSLNAGINLSNSHLVCCVDADTIIKKDALKEIVKPFIYDERVVAAGGNVRIRNDSHSLTDFPYRLRSPRKMITTFQVIEYIRSINVARNALALMNGNLIISGAFGVFKTGVLREIGGYEKFSKGEDFELITRIHFHMLKKKKPYKIPQVYSADSFTDAPERYRELKSQRKRWQIGLVSTIRAHFFKFFRFPFKAITFFSLPYFIIFEIISPFVQILTYFLIPALWIAKVIDIRYLILLAITLAYSCLINLLFLIIDFSLSSYYRFSDKFDLILTSFAEPFFYHQINCYWKVLGTIDSVKNVFVKAAWTPPRNVKDFQSVMAGSSDPLLTPGAKKGMQYASDYKSYYKERIIILALAGSFTVADIEDFEKIIDYYRSKKRKKFIIEMKKLRNMSSEALAAILKHAKELKRKKGGIVVINPNDKIEDELKISNAVKEIKIFKSYSDARKELLYG